MANLRGNPRWRGTSPQQARITDLQRFHRAYGETAIGYQPKTTIKSRSLCSRQNGNVGILRSGNQAERPSSFVRYRKGLSPLQTAPRYPELVSLPRRWPLLPLYRTPVWMEAFSILLRQVHAAIHRVHPRSLQSTYPPIHGRFIGRYLNPNGPQKSLTAFGQTATASGAQKETRERLLGRFATVGPPQFRDRHCSAMCLAGREHSPTVKQKEEKQQQKQPLPMARATERSTLPFPLCGLAAPGSSTPTGGG